MSSYASRSATAAEETKKLANLAGRAQNAGKMIRKLLVAAGVIAFAVPVVLGALSPLPQTSDLPPPATLPAFETISIRPGRVGLAEGIGGQFQPTRFSTVSVTLKTLLKIAYARPGATPNTALNLLDQELVGGPEWLNADKFDIVATTPTDTQPTPPTRQRQMLQRLLAERFKLAAHWETRESPAFALVRVRPDGPLASGLTPVSAEDCEKVKPTAAGAFVPGDLRCDAIIFDGQLAGGIIGLGARGAPMERLAQTLVSLRAVSGVDRMVLNRTGLEGNYAFALKFAVPRAADDLEHPTLFTALQEQLGLKLEPIRAPMSVLVIDRSEKPEPN
jgi:uncharacterized protein (TIGR03435 family)